ncbi:MAG: [FeFe] hydrogenase H-cluster radical SAM maturase HydE [Candidatus Margulisiibacteriota bacterium]|jgi:biotin synthase
MLKNLNYLLNKIDQNELLNQKEIVHLLRLDEPETNILFQKADEIRKKYLGEKIYLRGIIEFSNYCKKNCTYCGIRNANTFVERYRISLEEIIDIAKKIEKFKQTTVVLQSGEDMYFTKELIGEIINKIKTETELAVTLSLGERDFATYSYWQQKGMDRYLLRFETSNRSLFNKFHPDDNFDERLQCLENLKILGIQVGSGFLIGLPEETIEQLADDILFCTKLNLAMIGVGPFISHPNTPLKQHQNPFKKDIFYKTVAILRLLNKKSHIPATTAFDALDANGRNKLLVSGANVFMPNATPKIYRNKYLLYPGKPCVDETSDDCASCVLFRVKSLGREIGLDHGHFKS